MTDISIIQESTVNSHLDNCTESSITSPKYVSFFDLDLKKDETPVFFTGILGESRFNKALAGLSLIEVYEKQKYYLIKAFHNKDVIINYLKLYTSLLEKYITEEEFDKAIDENPNKYFISIDNKVNQVEMEIVYELVKEIGTEYSIQDVSEIFSIDLSDMMDKIARR
jgi:hypothetical protein